MPYQPPAKILITSDDSIIEYQRTIKKNKNNLEEKYVYKFTASLNREDFTKKDLEFEMTEEMLNKNLSNFFKVIE